MAEQMTLYLDTVTRDLSFDVDGNLKTVEKGDVTAQNIRNTLLVYRGEFPLFEPHGTDYGRLLGRKVSELEKGEAEEIIREAVLQDDNIKQINDLTVLIDGRTVKIELHGELYSGETIDVEVNTG